MYPTVILGDPINKVYDSFVEKVIHSLRPDEKGINIILVSYINDSEVLNHLLSRYYVFVRKELEKVGFDYTFDINIYFNVRNFACLIDPNSEVFKLENEELFSPGRKVIELQSDIQLLDVQSYKLSKNNITYSSQNVVALGGTFDHLHDGHKILLSMAIFLAKEKLIIGITGSKLLVNKKFASILDSFEIRLNSVIHFIKLLLPEKVRFEIYEINDVCGPTGFIPGIDTLVVSEESTKGATFVNNYRRERGFCELTIVEIKVVGDNDSNEENSWKGKLSSTDIREKEYKKLTSSSIL